MFLKFWKNYFWLKSNIFTRWYLSLLPPVRMKSPKRFTGSEPKLIVEKMAGIFLPWLEEKLGPVGLYIPQLLCVCNWVLPSHHFARIIKNLNCTKIAFFAYPPVLTVWPCISWNASGLHFSSFWGHTQSPNRQFHFSVTEPWNEAPVTQICII